MPSEFRLPKAMPLEFRLPNAMPLFIPRPAPTEPRPAMPPTEGRRLDDIDDPPRKPPMLAPPRKPPMLGAPRKPPMLGAPRKPPMLGAPRNHPPPPRNTTSTTAKTTSAAAKTAAATAHHHLRHGHRRHHRGPRPGLTRHSRQVPQEEQGQGLPGDSVCVSLSGHSFSGAAWWTLLYSMTRMAGLFTSMIPCARFSNRWTQSRAAGGSFFRQRSLAPTIQSIQDLPRS